MAGVQAPVIIKFFGSASPLRGMVKRWIRLRREGRRGLEIWDFWGAYNDEMDAWCLRAPTALLRCWM